MKKILFILISVLFTFFNAHSQEVLMQQLKGKKNFKEIMDIVYRYYRSDNVSWSSDEEEFEKDPMLWWKRFELYNRSRLNENGEVTNVNKITWENFKDFKQSATFKTAEANKTNINYGSWTPIGPTDFTFYGGAGSGGMGRVTCVAFHPTNANIFYIGTPQGGVWKTTDAGSTWTPKSDGMPPTGISGIVVGRNNPNLVYALTGDGDARTGRVSSYGYVRSTIGVMKSTDGGDTWQETGAFPFSTDLIYGYKLIQQPGNDSLLLAATSEGIYRSANGGNNWTQVQVGTFTDIEYKPGDNSIIYAARKSSSISEFYRSTDFGQNFNPITLPAAPIDFDRVAIGVSVNNPSKVYLVAGPSFSNAGIASYGGLLLSTNSGATFTVQSSTPNIIGSEANGSGINDQSWYNLCIEVDPDNHARVIVGATNLWRSTNSGSSFSNIAYWLQPTTPYVHADAHNLAYNPLNGLLYCCTDGGISVSSDDGTTWTWLSIGLQIMDFFHIAGTESDANQLIGGTQDNGINHRWTATNNYRHIYGGDGFDALIDYSDINYLYMTGNFGLARSSNGGASSLNLSPSAEDFPCVAQHTTNPAIIYCGIKDSIWKSTNRAINWTSFTTTAGGNIALITCPSNDNRMYASDGTNTYRSDNAGGSFTKISSNPGYPVNSMLTSMAVDQSNSMDVFATFGGFTAGSKVYYSTDGGANWINLSGSLPNFPAQSVAVDVSDNVYVGTDVGVFVRPNGATNWQPFYNGLPKTPVSELVINNESGLIRAGTFGRGIWSSSLYSACPTTIALGSGASLFGYRFYQASNQISSASTVSGGAGTEIYFKAGNLITLSDGFKAEGDKGFFKSWIAPCGTGIPNTNRVLTSAGISSIDEVASEIKKITSTSGQSPMIVNKKASGRMEVLINVSAEKEHVRLYLQNTDGEIAWMYRGFAEKGTYRFMMNTKKLFGKGLKLKAWVGMMDKEFQFVDELK